MGFSPSKSENTVSDSPNRKRGRKLNVGVPKPTTKAGDKKIQAAVEGGKVKGIKATVNQSKDVETEVAHEENTGGDVETVVAAAVEWTKTVVPDEGNVAGVVETLVENEGFKDAAPNDEAITEPPLVNKERKKSRKHPLHCVRNGSLKRATNHGSGMFRYL